MYEGCFLPARLSNTLNVSVDQKTWPRICFQTCGRAFETLSQTFETLGRAECLKSSAVCLCYNTSHAVPINQPWYGSKLDLKLREMNQGKYL